MHARQLRFRSLVVFASIAWFVCEATGGLNGAGGMNGAVAARAAELTAVGRAIEDFALPGCCGETAGLADYAEHELVVVAFLGAECPLARLYAPRLQQLCDEFAPRGVAFIGIDSNEQDTPEKMAEFARQYGVKFPLLKDADQAVADRFGVERNPMVFVLDRQRVVRYQGRVDDQYGLGSSSGYARPEVKRRDLATALDELLAGGEVSVTTTHVTGCLIGRRPRVEPQGEITFARHIAPLLDNHCVSCHRPGEIGPFSLTEFDDVVAWADMVREVVADGRMPPWTADSEPGHFRNDPRLSEEQKQWLFTWVDNGCPLGDLAERPEPPSYTDGWQIDEPDEVVLLPTPTTVPAEGVLPYRYALVDPGWKEDRWIQQAEARPDNRAVVHHILVFLIPPSSNWLQPQGEGGPGGLTSFVPGSPPVVYPPGAATFVPAGSRLFFEIHYTPSGTEQRDQSYVGIKFADPGSVKRRAFYEGAENRQFEIPAYADDHELESRHEFKEDQLLLAMAPHMHLRGKAFRFEAHYPDGTQELLLDVPRFDFNWQLRYELAQPKRLPAGTTLVCKGRYDNSESNLANPDPSATLRFGWQTWDEMMTGFFLTMSAEDDVAVEIDGSAANDAPAAGDAPAASNAPVASDAPAAGDAD